MSEGALDGVKVLDCTQILAGPFCTMMLGDMGADVIKVEKPSGGDDTRRMGPPFVGDTAAAFLMVNRNKRSLALDLKSPDGIAVFHRLVEWADVLVENLRPGAMIKLGLGYDQLKSKNPKLVYCSISGFGATGPYKNRAGFDLVAQGMSPGAAMAFLTAGAVSCIPAMAAVWSLVRLPIFATYVALGLGGAVVAGMVFSLAV